MTEIPADPAALIAAHVAAAASRPRLVRTPDADALAAERLRLAREERQDRFDIEGLPRTAAS